MRNIGKQRLLILCQQTTTVIHGKNETMGIKEFPFCIIALLVFLD